MILKKVVVELYEGTSKSGRKFYSLSVRSNDDDVTRVFINNLVAESLIEREAE